MTDEEFRLLMEAPEDNLPKQRARGGGSKRGKMTALTMPDDDFLAAMGDLGGDVPRGKDPITPSDYALTDYAGIAKRMSPPDVDLTPRNEDGTQDTSRVSDHVMRGIPGYQDAGDEGRGFANFALGMLVPGAISPALARMGAGTRLAAAGGQAAGGAVQETAGGGSPRDILMATLAGGALGGLTASPPRAAHAPLTQAEIDSAALTRRGPVDPAYHLPPGEQARMDAHNDRGFETSYQRPDLPKGSRGTEQMATDAEMVLNNALGARRTAQKSDLHTRELEARARNQGLTENTEGDIAEIRRLRAEGRGANGPVLPESDRRLAAAENQLSRPEQVDDPGIAPYSRPNPNLQFDELNNLRKGLNYRVENSPPTDLGNVGDRLAAGIAAGATRRMDARTMGGQVGEDFGHGLDRYAAEGDRLKRGNVLLYDRPQVDVPTEQGVREAARGRISRAGQVTADDAATSHQNERRLGELGQVEPAGNDLISHIRARNTSARRGMFTLPNLLSSNPVTMGARTIQHNASNLGFKLRRPEIDDAGMVAARPASRGADLALPLEIQLMLMQQERERRNAGQ